MVELAGTIVKLRRFVDNAGSRTWFVYEDNKAGGGIYAKVVPFSDVDTIVSNNPPAQYGNLLLNGAIQIVNDTTVYSPSAGKPQYFVKDMSLNLYQNFLGVAITTGKLPNDDSIRVHLGQLRAGAGGTLTYTACATSPLDIQGKQLVRYDVIQGVNKEINIIHTRDNKVHANGH